MISIELSILSSNVLREPVLNLLLVLDDPSLFPRTPSRMCNLNDDPTKPSAARNVENTWPSDV